MTLISVITPVGAGTPARYLAAAYASLVAQELPVQHDWEWLVQGDGDATVPLPEDAAHDRRVQLAHGPRGGAAMARNLALARSAGTIIVVLDADDQLTPGALGRIVNTLIDPDIGWTTSALIDLLPDGTRRRFTADPPAGMLPRGSVTRYWRNHNWTLQVHPSTLAVRRELILAAGGWMGLPVSEDMGLLVALDQSAHGAFIAEPGVLRRIHPAQMTQRPEHPLLVSHLRALIWERASALDPLIAARENPVQTTTPTPGRLTDSSPEPNVPAPTPAARGALAHWPIRAVMAVALVHLGMYIGIAAADPDRWADIAAIAAISVVFYACFAWLALVVSRRIRADPAPSRP